jgi:hypothetical protein
MKKNEKKGPMQSRIHRRTQNFLWHNSPVFFLCLSCFVAELLRRVAFCVFYGLLKFKKEALNEF